MTKFNLNVLKKKIDKYNTYMHEWNNKGRKVKEKNNDKGEWLKELRKQWLNKKINYEWMNEWMNEQTGKDINKVNKYTCTSNKSKKWITN